MLHKYCLQNRNIFYSINSRLQLPLFFFFFFLPLSRLNRFNINKKSFLKKKIAISYSNLMLLFNFFMKKKKKKKKLLPRKTLFTKNRTTRSTLPIHLRWFLCYYLYYYLFISILLFKGLFLFGFLIF